MTARQLLPSVELSAIVKGPARVWKLAVTESAAVRLLVVALTVMSSQSRPAGSMRGVVGLAATPAMPGGLSPAVQPVPPGRQLTNVTTCALGWLLTLPSALRTAMKVTYWVPLPNRNWSLPAGRVADQAPLPLGVSCSVAPDEPVSPQATKRRTWKVTPRRVHV